MVRTRRDRALGRSASSIILAADGHGHGGPSSPPTRMTTTVTPALVEAKIAAQRYEKAKKVMRGKKAEHTAAFEGRVNVKCRYSDRAWFSSSLPCFCLCFIPQLLMYFSLRYAAIL